MMYRFFDSVIKPVMDLLHPKVVVEIGSDEGLNTKRLLPHCRELNATLHAIDPVPKFDVAEWEREFEDYFVFYETLSLDALPCIDAVDLVLVDGDHNWYTVYTELKLIEMKTQERSGESPIVLHHDIGWPYARRDVYYYPETIPDAYLKPHEKLGMLPGSSQLVAAGGVNPSLFNSTCEGGPQNGVLTAIDDFMKASDQDFRHIVIPALNGLGVLIPSTLKEGNPALWRFVNSLMMPPNLDRIARDVERYRVEETQMLHDLLQAKEKERQQMQALNNQLEAQVAALSEQMERLQALIPESPGAAK